jgi:glycosyltransferase involved in cell wall biosynthesis
MSEVNKKTRVLICGSHPTLYNGYSKVLFELVCELAKHADLHISVFGFQNMYKEDEKTQEHKKTRVLPENVYVYDVVKYENLNLEKTKHQGFGEMLFKDVVLLNTPDILIIYNDMTIITNLYEQIKDINHKMKIVPYIDLVYENHKSAFLKHICDKSDAGIFFSKKWEDSAAPLFPKPKYILEHGFNADNYWPIDKQVARQYIGLPNDMFIITNLNRNQPRKSWDICVIAYIDFLCRYKHLTERIIMYVATAPKGGWNLDEIIKYECHKRKLSFERIRQKFHFSNNPQMLSDYEINILYNIGDIGVNTCNGEGFGLCNFEQAALGTPQIVPSIGTFPEFFNKDNSILIEPTEHYYMEANTLGGQSSICNPAHFADAFEKYYMNRDLVTEHGKSARKSILRDYKWKDKTDVLYDIIKKETAKPYV